MTKVKDLETQIEKIISTLKEYQSKGGYTASDIQSLQEKLADIDEKVSCFFHFKIHFIKQWQDNAIKEDDGTIAAGQAELSDLLNDAHDLIADLLDALPDE